jgi:hypothetical protein
MRPTFSLRLILRSLVAAALAAVFIWPSMAAARGQSQPSLAELAKQEAERRKTVKDTKKVITAKDLPESARRPASASAPAEGGAAEAGGDQKPAAAAAEAAPDDRGEAAWRQRMTAAREGLRRNQVVLDALQMRVNGLTADYDRHDPFERNGIGETRKKALEEIEHVKADIEASKKQIADIEEEARKAGVPPGWVR